MSSKARSLLAFARRRTIPAPEPRFDGHIEELEPRILFNADVAALLPDPAIVTMAANPTQATPVVLPPATVNEQASGTPADTSTATAAPAPAAAKPTEIIFVDARVPDAQQLMGQILSQQDGQHTLEIHWLSADRDGVAQISEVLNGRQDVAALHLISHGADGSVQLGNTWLNESTLPQHLQQLSGWHSALSTGADILLYGCDVAQTVQGQRFVDDLSLLTGADVAASTDITGATSKGGDWALEYAHGGIQALSVGASGALAGWDHTLVTTSFQDGASSYTGTEDTQIILLSPSTDYSSSATLYAGRDGTYSPSQALIKFNNIVGTGTGQIPSGSVITSVTLTLNVGGGSASTLAIYRMLASWSDTSTWNSLSSGVSADNSEAKSSSDATSSISGTSNYTLGSNAALIATVQAWVDNPSSNQGWMLDATNGMGNWNSRVTVQSSETGTAGNRPKLTVTYTAPTPPSLDLDANNSSGATGSNYNGAFTEQTAVNVVDSDATVTAGTSSNLTGMTVTISNLLDGTAESLAATVAGTSITASYASGTGILTLSGTDTAAHYQQVLRTVQYNNSSDNPTTTTRTINIVASDAYGSSSTATSSLTVTRVNDAPVISSNGGGTSAPISVKETITAVTTVVASDPEGTSLTYSVSGTDAARFSIDASSGILTFAAAPDYEAPTDANGDNIYLVTVQASDGTLTDTQNLTVTVTDVASTLVVTTTADTNDSGLGSSFTAEQLNAVTGGTDTKVSLREALIAANTTSGTDTITFSIATGTAGTGSDAGAYVITATSALPTITQAVVINASTQSGYVAGGLHTVILDGGDAAAYGLDLTNTADGSTIRGLLIRNFTSYGIYVESGSDSNTIVGNFIGSFYADGTNSGAGTGNATDGIRILGATTVVGGTTTADRNVISGNAGGHNIYLATGANGTTISGNYIGLNASGGGVFSAVNPDYGIMIESSATNITIGGTATGSGNVISGHQREGIWVTTSGTVTIQGNYIGTNAAGTVDRGNGRYGIYLDDNGTATIGGTATGAGNVISGNDLGGIYAANNGVTIYGNIIGLNATGTAALANTGSGIELRTGGASTIGGNGSGYRNVISGNTSHGIDVETDYAHVIKGNYIGVGSDGTTLLGNGGAGIYIAATGVTVGGKASGDGNIIAGNGSAGIVVASGTNNLFYRNSIYSNTGIGIDLANDGVTANDLNDGDGGANWRNNFPVITSVVTNGTSTTIQGSVDWYHNSGQTIYIELFSSTSADATGYGEGKTYLGAATVTSNSLGDATFSLTVTGVSVGDWITAIANYETAAFGASEFAKAVQAVAPANAPRGRLIWNGNDQFFQGYADWSTAGFGGVGTNGIAYSDDISMIAAWEAPTRNEILFIGSADVSGKILAGIWNGTSWSSVISLPISDPADAASKYDCFAVAYDQISGDAMLVWDNGGTGLNGLSYATWNGTSWSSTSTITAPVSGEAYHMKLASNPRGHDMVLAVENSSASNNQYAIVWNGSSWGNSQTLGTNTNDQYFELNVAYEQQSGKAMVVYDASASNSANIQYRTWNGSSWSSEGTITAAAGVTATSDLYSTAIASDPTSNRIAIAAKNAANEVWLSVWDGSSTWGSSQLATASGVSLTDDHPTMAVAFESQSGDLLAVYGKAAGPNIYYRTWTSGGGWSAEGTGPSMGGTDIPYIAKLYADPYTNTIMMGVQDNAADLHMAAWDGSAWGSVTQMDSDTGFTYRENFTYVWFQNAPVIANVAGDTLGYTEDQSAQVIDQGTAATVTMSDETLYNGGNLTVSFTAGSTSGEDVLAIRNQGSGAGQIGVSGANVTYAGTTIGTYTGGTSGSNLVITFNSNATNAAVTALVKNITYQNTNTATPSTSSRTVRFVVTNALSQASATSDATVTVTAVNDAPTNTVPGAQSVNEDNTLIFSSGNGNLVSIADVDAASSSVQVTLTVTNGTLSLSGVSGLSFSVGDGVSDTTMTFTGTVSAINTALAGMGYTPTANYNGAATLSITTSDLGNTGSGGTQTDSDTVNITVNAVNDAPVNSVPGAQSTNEDTSLTFSSGNSNLISITDVDAASGSMQVTLSVTNGTLSLSGTSGLSFSVGDGSTDTTMTFTGTVSAINTALAGLVYAPTGNYNGAAVLTITTSDQGNTGSGGTKSDSDTVNITVNAVNDTPVNTVPGAQSTNEDTNLTFSSGNSNLISIADVDAASGSMQVTLSVAHGSLTLSGTSGLSFSAGDGSADSTMTFTGTASAINTALAGLVYAPTGDYNGGDTLTITTSDQGNTGSGGAKTDSDTVAITVNAVNDTPVNTVPGAQSVNEDTTLTFSSGNGNLVSIADVDAASGSMQVTLTVTNGTLSLSGVSGLSFSVGDGVSDTTMTFTGTVSAINTALAGMGFAPTGNYNGAATLTITTSDQGNTGSGGAKSDSDVVNITVNAVNDTPVNTVPAAQSTNEDTSLTFSSGNGNLISIADVDAASGSMQVTLSVTNGTLSLSGVAGLSFSVGDGSTDTTMTFTGTVSAINTALAGLVYAPTANYNGAAVLTITTSDQGNTGSGGTQTDSDTVNITVNAVNDAPVNSVPGAQSTNEDTSLTFSSGNSNLISISDVDASSGSMQVTLSVTNGRLTLSGTAGLSFTAGDGNSDTTMTFTGTVSAINTALAGLVYAPTANYNGAAVLTITTSDQGNTGSGGTKTDSDTVAITVNAVNDAPVNTKPGGQTINEDATLTFSSGNGNAISIADTDAGASAMKLTLSVTNGTLTLSGTTGLSFTTGDGTADATMVFTGTRTNINNALAGLTFTPTANYNGTATLTITSDDQGNTGSGGAKTDVDTVTITINAVNDAPTADIAPPTYSATEQVSLVLHGTGLSVADIDAGSSTVQATLSVTSGTLTVAAGTSGVTVGGSGTNTVTLTGTLTQINNLLAGNGGATLSYLINSDAPPATDTLTLLVSDQGNTGSGGTLTGSDTATINITTVNDTPATTITAPSYSVVENMSLTLENTGLSVSDPDGSGISVQVTLSADIGALTVAAGTTGVTVGGSGTDTVTLSGTITQINNLLSGNGGATVSYINNSATTTASAVLTLAIDDLGNTGGGHLTASSNVAINVVPAAAMGTIGLPGLSPSDIAAYYGFDASANLGRDDSAGNHNMTLVGVPTFVAGHDGRNSAINVVNDDTGGGTLAGGDIAGLSTGGAMTVSMWVKFDSFNAASGGADRLIDFGQTNATGIGNIVIARNAATQQISFILQHDNVTQDVCTMSVADSVQIGQWAHIAATVDGSGLMKIYFNGTLSGTLQGTALATGVRDHNYVAQSNAPGTYGLNGSIDDLLVAKRAMSATEIAALYNQANGLNVYEKSANGTAIGTVLNGSSIDGRTVTYSLQNSGGGRFAIDANTGLITVADSANLLHSGAASYTISVRALDSGGFALDTNYTINLVNINDAPIGTSNTVTTLEDSPYVFSTSDFGFTDPDDTSANALLAVKITSVPASGSLTLNGVAVSTNDTISAADIASGKLQFNAAADAHGNGYASFDFKVQDDGGTANGGTDLDATARTMTVNVTSVNDAPHGANHTATTLEDAPYVFATTDFGFTDGDGNTLQAVKITGLPLAGTLTLDGVAVSNNDVIAASDIAAGKLVFTAAPDANGAGYASFTFKVQDDGGTANGGIDLAAANSTMTLNVTAVNDAPQGSNNTVSTNEDTPYVFQASDFGFSDTADSPANTLQAVKLSTLPASGTLTLNGVAVSVGQLITLADINSGLLVFTPVANASGAGYATLGFQVQDNGGTANGGVDLDTSIRTLTIDVNAVNDAPTTNGVSVSGNEDNAIAGVVTGADVDGDGLTFSKGSDPTHGAVVVASNGSFNYTPAADFNGSDSFTVTVSDGHGGTATSTVTVTVNAVNDAPTANNPAVGGNEDTTINGNIIAGDVDGDTLAYTKFSEPTHGTAIVNSNGSFSYTPNANYYGSDSFTVTVSDGHGGTTASTINITVTPVNDSPTTNDVAASGNEDNAITGSVTGSDVDGDTLSFTKSADPSHGSVNVAADGSFTYTPTANFHGSDSFTVLVADGHGGTATSTVTVTVASVNDAPTANNPSLSGAEDHPITGSVAGSDVDGDTLSYTKTSDPAHGSVNVASDGSFTYTPTGDFHGADSFTVTVSDGHGGTVLSTITLTVTPVNDAPTANNPAISGAEDSVLSGQITAGDVDGDSLGYQVTTDAAHGQVSLASDGSFTYTPDADFHGSDSFTVRVDDGQGGTATSTITVTVTAVNDAPTANNPSVSGSEDGVILGQITAGDVDGDTLGYSQSSAPSHGNVTVNSDGSFSYTPTADFNGSDSFTVLVDDGHGGTTTSTITVTVAPVNDTPTADNPSASGNEDTVITGQVNGNDVDGDTLSYTKLSNPAHGVVNVASDGSFSYTPNANFHGSDSFTVLVDDGQGGTTTSTVTLTINAVNDAPTTNDQAASGAEDHAITGQVTGSDADGDTLSYSQGSGPAHGSVNVAADGSFSYTPTADFHGSDSFTVTVSDGHGGSTTSTITLTVTPVNDAPTTNDVATGGAEDTVITGQVAGSDVDGDTISFTKGSDPTHGSVTVQSDGSFSYTPTANFNGTDSFTVTLSDGHGGTATSTVTLTVTSVNDAPTVIDPSFSGNEDTAITGSITGTDVDADTLSYVKGSDPLHGTVIVNNSGGFTYTPTADYNGADSFTVTISDGHGGTTTAHVSLTIAAVNDAPLANTPGSPYAATEQVSLNLANTGLSVSDADAGNSIIQVAISVTSGTLSVTAGSTGVVIIDASDNHLTLNGTQAQINALLSGNQGATLRYTLNQDAPPATDLLTLHVDDLGNAGLGGAQAANTSALIQITAVDDAPVMTPGTGASSASPSITWSTGTLLNGATDPDGHTLTIRIVQEPQHGTVTVSNGQVTYTTSPGYVGSDSFSYEAYNGQMGSGSTSTMTVQASSPMPPAPSTSPPTSDDTDQASSDPASSGKPPATDASADSQTGSGAKPTADAPTAKPLDPGAEEHDKTASSLHDRVTAAPWANAINKGGDTTGMLRQALFSPGINGGSYGGAAGINFNAGSPVIQLLDLIKPTIERVQDINLVLTPLSSVTHALPAQISAEADNKPGEDGSAPPIRFERVATYSTGLGLSIGTIWWTARISGLVTSALISTPAWRSLDPLPVLTSPTSEEDDDEHDADSHLGDREVEHLFDGDKPMEQDMPVIQ